MSRQQKYDLFKNTFPFPNDVFLLGLCPGELAVYAYLLRCESCQRQPEIVDFRRNKMSFFGGRHSSLYSPFQQLHLPA